MCFITVDASLYIDFLLRGGSVPNEGRLETLYQGSWLPYCGWIWDNRSSDVMCRQLGYEKGVNFTIQRETLDSSVWLSSLECKGDEKILVTCSYIDVSFGKCNYSIWLECQRYGKLSSAFVILF